MKTNVTEKVQLRLDCQDINRLEIWRMFRLLRRLWQVERKKEELLTIYRIVGYQGSTHSIDVDGAIVYDAYVYYDEVQVAAFELMTINNTALVVNHFAVLSQYVGKKMGKSCLMAFAGHVAAVAPKITEIQFDLYRATDHSDIERLACARIGILERIGAINIQRQILPNARVGIRATWPRQAWGLD